VEVLEAIKGRRSIRKYTKDSVPEDLVVKILDAGRWAPSAGNSQPWSFIVLKDEEVRKRVANATTYGKFLADAPLGIAVVVDPQASTHPVEDGAIATQNLLIAAHAYGSIHEKRVKEILNIPKSNRLLSIISIGFPAESPTKTRKELREIMFTDRYGS